MSLDSSSGNSNNNKPVIIAFEGFGMPSDEVNKAACIKHILRTAETSIKNDAGIPYIDIHTAEGIRYLRSDRDDVNFYTVVADLFASVLMLHEKNARQDSDNRELRSTVRNLSIKVDTLEENIRTAWSEVNEYKSRLSAVLDGQ